MGMMAVCEVCWGRTFTPRLVNGRCVCPECVEKAKLLPALPHSPASDSRPTDPRGDGRTVDGRSEGDGQ
jgi:hypothetical protein